MKLLIKKIALNKIYQNIFKIIIFLSLLIYIYFEIDFSNFFNSRSLAKHFILFISVIFLGKSLITYLMFLRWYLLINITSDFYIDKKKLIGPLIYSSLAAEFFFLGFLSRTTLTLTNNIKISNVISSAIIEKILSIYAILILIIISLVIPSNYNYILGNYLYILLTPIIFLLFFPFFVFKLNQSSKIFKFIINMPFIFIFKNFINHKIFLMPLFFSILIHIINAICFVCVPLLLEINFKLFDYVLFLPIIIFFSTIPISFSDWGWREFVLIILLQFIGIIKEDAFLIGITLGTLYLLSSIFFVFFYEVFNRLKKYFIN